MSVSTKTTELEALNSILSAAGELPVTSLADTSADAVLANDKLDEANREIQSRGWFWNTRIKEYTPAAGVITIADDILRVDGENYGGLLMQVTVRGGKLYNMISGLDNDWGSDTLNLKVVELLAWADLPEAARQAILRKAARIFVEQHVSDPNLVQIATINERFAYALLEKDEIDTSNSRVFGPTFTRIVDAPRALDWIRG